jgi:D-alanyl-D-alanine carboxypeptidase/D-alanyl-D-alanine-endopeptidase (penicillin-binding protein 4)
MSYSRPIGPKRSSPAPNNASRCSAFEFAKTLRFQTLVWSVLIASLTVGCARSENPTTSDPSPAAGTDSGSAAIATSLPVNADRKLGSVLDDLLDSPEFSHARWGVSVISLKDGKLIYDHNGDEVFTPASNMKVYTTAVALDFLGTGYQWRTSVYSDSEPDANGTVAGDLVLYGRGAPDLIAETKNDNSNSIERLAKMLAERGIKRIQGNVIGDESYFRGDATGEGWQWNDLQWYFGAEASALTVNANSVEVSITPATKMGDPPTLLSNDTHGYVQLINNLISVDRSAPLEIGIKRELSDNNVIVWGQYPLGARGYGASLSVHRPSLWAAIILLNALKAHGISVDGVAKFRDSRLSERERFNPEGKHELAFVSSKPLAEIIKVTNKFSVNLYAELLLRTLGRERAALLQTGNSGGRELGDDERGTNLVRLWLSRQGIKTSGLAIHDGSGLSRLNLVTPQATALLLAAMRKTNSGEVFMSSLPVAGTDGTLQGRLQATNGKVAAKTGALSYDNSLSGYLTASDGQMYAFSVICNDFVGRGGPIRLIDQLMLAMFEYIEKGSSHPKGSSQ